MDLAVAKQLATDFAKEPKKPKAKQVELIEHPLVQYIRTTYPNVCKLELPTFEQAENLIKKCGKQFVADKLKALENMPELSKKYKYVHLTIESWHSMAQNKASEASTGKTLPIL